MMDMKMANMATNTHRNYTSGVITITANQCTTGVWSLGAVDNLETVMATSAIPYYDFVSDHRFEYDSPQDITVESGMKTFKIYVFYSYEVLEMRNNGTHPIHIQFWWFRPRRALGSTEGPYEEQQAALITKGVSANYYTDPRYGPWDGGWALHRKWKCYKKQSILLNTAQSIKVRYGVQRPYWYDPIDARNTHYDKHRSRALVYRAIGPVSHDETTPTNVGTCDGQIDYIRHNYTKYSVMPHNKFKFIKVGSGELGAQAAAVMDVEAVLPDQAKST